MDPAPPPLLPFDGLLIILAASSSCLLLPPGRNFEMLSPKLSLRFAASLSLLCSGFNANQSDRRALNSGGYTLLLLDRRVDTTTMGDVEKFFASSSSTSSFSLPRAEKRDHEKFNLGRGDERRRKAC